jgi:hypothetical protein
LVDILSTTCLVCEERLTPRSERADQVTTDLGRDPVLREKFLPDMS